MAHDTIFLRSTGVRLPTRLLVADAVASGDCPARTAERTGTVSVSHSPDESAPEMAVRAARAALDRADTHPDDIALILHADTYHQGRDLWATASYIQRETLGNTCPAVEIRQMSNGGLAALDLASAYLTAGSGRAEALLTTADRFCLPGVDRWRTDPGAPYGDGGSAVVLSRHGGFAALRSLALFSDSDLEPLHRGDNPFSAAPFTPPRPVDFETPKRSFFDRAGLSYVAARCAAGQRTVVKRALSEAGMELADASWVLLPHLGRRRMRSAYCGPFGIDPDRTAWEWSRTVGHLGAGDQFAGLDWLVTSGRAAPGDRCVLVSVGAGYSWGCAVIEILARPSWAGS